MSTMQPLNNLLDRESARDLLTPELNRLYAGKLGFPESPADRPITIINFVTTLEGLTSFMLPGQEGGGEISGFNAQDKFVMGLLRALADAVVVGANTLRKEPEHLWTPAYISGEHTELFAELRRKLGKTRVNPLNMFVTGSGKVLPKHSLPAVFRSKDVESLIVTTDDGKKVVEQEFAGQAEPQVVTFGSGREVDLKAMMRHLRQIGVELLLVEGGAGFNGNIVDAELYDELFLTRAPQIIGTSKDHSRPLFLQGFSRTPQRALWHELVSIKVSGDYLYERYRRKI